MITTAPEMRAAPARSIESRRAPFFGTLASEWTKLSSVRSTRWSIGTIVVLGIGLGALSCAEARVHWPISSPGFQPGFDPTQQSLIGVFFAQLIIGVLGVLVISAEYATGTIRASFAAAPRRVRVLGAKVAVFGALAFVVSELVSFASFLLGQDLLGYPAVHTSLANPTALRAVFGSGLFLCLLGLFALAIGSLIRHTAGAISAYVATLLVAPLIVAALPNSIAHHIQRFMPANIGRSIISMNPPPHLFSAWTGLIVLACYSVALLGIAALALVRRDA